MCRPPSIGAIQLATAAGIEHCGEGRVQRDAGLPAATSEGKQHPCVPLHRRGTVFMSLLYNGLVRLPILALQAIKGDGFPDKKVGGHRYPLLRVLAPQEHPVVSLPEELATRRAVENFV